MRMIRNGVVRFARHFASILQGANPDGSMRNRGLLSTIGVIVWSDIPSQRVFGDEPTNVRVEVARPEIVETSLAVKFAARVLKRIRQRAGRSNPFAEGIVCVRLRQRSEALLSDVVDPNPSVWK